MPHSLIYRSNNTSHGVLMITGKIRPAAVGPLGVVSPVKEDAPRELTKEDILELQQQVGGWAPGGGS
jgi:hypothetical protein